MKTYDLSILHDAVIDVDAAIDDETARVALMTSRLDDQTARLAALDARFDETNSRIASLRADVLYL